MPEKILPDIYRIEIPLPKSPLKSINSYLIKGPERNLIIDTGLNSKEGREKMLAEMKSLDVDLKKTDFFITHMHADHLSLLFAIITDESKPYFNAIEFEIINNDRQHRQERIKVINDLFLSHGFPEDELQVALAGHMGFRAVYQWDFEFHILKEDDILEVGDYRLHCIETPGHSPGHLCLYEPDKKILFAGDHILFDITPNITYWSMMKNSLGSYLSSLEKVYSLDTKLVLPGHRRRMENHQERIDQLRRHHQERLNEVLAALKDGSKSAYEIGSYLTWDIVTLSDSWDVFPPTQKWFAIGETLAHLVFLEEEHKIKRVIEKNKVLFSLA